MGAKLGVKVKRRSLRRAAGRGPREGCSGGGINTDEESLRKVGVGDLEESGDLKG